MTDHTRHLSDHDRRLLDGIFDDADRERAARTVATPAPATVYDRRGTPRLAAHRGDYPLTGTCGHCGEPIRCADGTADWTHIHGFVRCLELCAICGDNPPEPGVPVCANSRCIGQWSYEVHHPNR